MAEEFELELVRADLDKAEAERDAARAEALSRLDTLAWAQQLLVEGRTHRAFEVIEAALEEADHEA